MKNFNSRGFTLIELLIVISIIGVLSSIVVTSTSNARSKSRDAQRIAQFRQVYTALELYYGKYGQYPALSGVPTPYDSAGMPFAWSSMLDTLESEGYITKADYLPNQESKGLAVKNFLKTTFDKIGFYPRIVYASVGPSTPTNITPQDPLYPTETYAYVPSNDNSNYRIRAKLENVNTALNSSVRGVFYTAGQTTGDSACDISLKYYCLGSNPSVTFVP